MSLYVVEAAVIVAAFAGMLWLRRAADRSWAAHVQMRQSRESLVSVQIVIRDRLTPALQKAAADIAALEPVFQRIGRDMKKAMER